MPGVVAAPFIALRHAGPVTESAIGPLEILQPVDAGTDVLLDLRFFIIVKIHQLIKHQLRKHGRRCLLNATMRVFDQVTQPLLQVHGGYAGYLYHGCTGRRYADGRCRCIPLLPGRQGNFGDAGYRRVGISDIQFHFVIGFFIAGAGQEFYLADTHIGFYPNVEINHLLTYLCKVDGLRSTACHFQEGICLEGDVHFPDKVLHRKNRYRQFDGFAGAQYPWHRCQHHQRFFYGNGFFGGSITSVVRRDDHGPHRTDIGGKCEGLFLRLIFIQVEGTEEFHHGFETVGGLLFAAAGFVITADGEDAFEIAAPGADHIVEHVETFYAERFPCVERVVRVGCFETGKIKQAFIHDRHHIGHFFSCLFTHGERYILFWADAVGDVQYRCKQGVLVFHEQRDRSVHADREVIDGLRMRLQ